VALSGEGLYRFGREQTLVLTAGEILLLPAGTRHGIEVKHHLRMAVIHVHPEAFDSVTVARGAPLGLLKQLKSWTDPPPARKVIAPEIHGLLERLTEETIVEQNGQDVGRESLLRLLAGQAVVHFLRLMLLEEPAEASGQTARRIKTVQGWIDRHFAEDCGVASLAKMAHLSPTYFAARFCELVGTPPMTYVVDRRLAQARALLQRTDQQVKVIAWSVGFSDVSHFNQTFRRTVGMTPLAYRAKSRLPRSRI
jgi:AraC-like DNA-binding protein